MFQISKLSNLVRLPAFLQFVGMFLALGALLLLDAHGFVGHVAKFVAFIALGVAFAGYLYDKIYVALILAVLLIFAPLGLRAQTPSPSVLLTWDASTSSSPTNPGNYGVYRAVSVAGACGQFSKIATVPLLTFADANVAAGVTYCYAITFIYAPSGTPATIETAFSDLDPTDQITIGPIPGSSTTPPPPTFKAASPKNLVGKIQ